MPALPMSRRTLLAGLGAGIALPRFALAESAHMFDATVLGRWSADILKTAATATPNTNVVLGAYSLHAGLTALSLGATGEQQKVIRSSKLFGGNGLDKAGLGTVTTTYQDFAKSIAPNKDDPTEIRMAYAIWTKMGTQLTKETAAKAEALFKAVFTKEIDFSKPEAAAEINAFVDKETKNKITKIIERTSAETQIALVNAMYFKGLWVQPFDAAETADADFTTAAGAVKKVPTMHKVVQAHYGETETARVVALPYGKGDVSRSRMYIVLPKTGPFDPAKGNLAAEVRAAALKPTLIDVALPRFKVAFQGDVTELLAKTELKSLVDGSTKLTGLTGHDIGAPSIIHAARIEVDEAGTEAAAATAVVGTRSAAPMTPFKIDRPFAFSVTMTDAAGLPGLDLVQGYIADPSI